VIPTVASQQGVVSYGQAGTTVKGTPQVAPPGYAQPAYVMTAPHLLSGLVMQVGYVQDPWGMFRRINPGETIVLVHFGPCAIFLHFEDHGNFFWLTDHGVN
jgi:hypothetical protein